jgi:hypothetical protein
MRRAPLRKRAAARAAEKSLFRRQTLGVLARVGTVAV